MPFVCYEKKRFTADSLMKIEQANEIITEYQEGGMVLSLRQLYYQFVSKNYIPNTEKSYKNLAALISNGRLAGLIDWDAIEDRGRSANEHHGWSSPNAALRSTAHWYTIDPWLDQPNYIEAWVEKDALSSVVETACEDRRVLSFACKGYASASSVYAAARRISEKLEAGKTVTILHLGDHDPSGIDMTRDNKERLEQMIGKNIGEEYLDNFNFQRLGLNMDQIKKYKPPPNPAKQTDIRFAGYMEKFGYESWELDALDPKTIRALVSKHIEALVDDHIWNASMVREEKEKKGLIKLSQNYQG